MAKRKHHKRKMSGVRRKHRKGLGAIDTQNILGVVAGAVAGGYLNKIVPATINDKVLAGGKVALGIALPMFWKKPIANGIGAGLLAVGSVDLLKSFGALSGDFDLPTISGDVLAGDLDVVNGDVLAEDMGEDMGADLNVVNGDVLAEDMGEDFGEDFGEDLSGDED